MLPFTPNNRQQLPRKRYIGNDIVTVVFQESDAKPFIPNLKSQFQHVFIVVRALTNGKEYAVAISRAKSVPMFGPPLPSGGVFKKNRLFTDFLLAKIINAENAAHKADKFVSMAIRTRQELLKDLASNYITPTTLESGSKFNLFNHARKKDKVKPRFSPDCSGLKGSLSWRVVAEDCSGPHTTLRSHSREVDAILGISPDSVILTQENLHHDVLFLTATKSVIGWTALQNSIRIYFHQGEAIILHSKDWESEDMSEISQRLKAVSQGAPTQEFTLRRNQLGQLGFHVQHDGLITEVENFGYAWQTGLRQGSRLVEICKHPVTALTHEQMVDLLKTSMTVTVTVIPPFPDGSPRKGCHLKSCSYAYGGQNGESGNSDGDYENVNGAASSDNSGSNPGAVPSQQTPSADKLVYDQQRSLSPPRSSSSSGYGTGSSRKSSTVLNQFTIPGSAGSTNSQTPQQMQISVPTVVKPIQQHHTHQIQQHKPVHHGHQILKKQTSDGNNGAGSSSSSGGGHSSDERWYDFGDLPPSSSENSPPPLPNRLLGGKSSAFQKVHNHAGQSGSSNVQVIGGVSVLTNVNGGHSSSNSATSSPAASIYQHPPPPKRIANGHHSKVQRKFSGEERRDVAKVTYLTEFELNNRPTSNSDYHVQHERLRAIKSASIPNGSSPVTSVASTASGPERMAGGDSVSLNEPLISKRSNHRSEDELSAISNGK